MFRISSWINFSRKSPKRTVTTKSRPGLPWVTSLRDVRRLLPRGRRHHRYELRSAGREGAAGPASRAGPYTAPLQPTRWALRAVPDYQSAERLSLRGRDPARARGHGSCPVGSSKKPVMGEARCRFALSGTWPGAAGSESEDQGTPSDFLT